MLVVVAFGAAAIVGLQPEVANLVPSLLLYLPGLHSNLSILAFLLPLLGTLC